MSNPKTFWLKNCGSVVLGSKGKAKSLMGKESAG